MNPQRILIAGCGYVGLATAKVFHDAGWAVEGWTSSAASAQALAALPFQIRAVDLTNRDAVSAAAGAFDVVIHCASSRGGGVETYRRIYLAGAQNLAAAFPKSLLLFTSSTSVYAQTSGEWVTEASTAEPSRETGRVLRETEQVVLGSGGVVARLAGIYGPDRSALLRKFLAGEALLDPGEQRFINQVHRDDIASALFVLAKRFLQSDHEPDQSGMRIFNVSDNHPTTARECYEWLAAKLNRPLPPTGAAPAERKRGNSNKRVSSAKLQAIGWTPRYPTFQAAMEESILPEHSRSHRYGSC